MIAKITRGSDAVGLARYLHGPGRSNEHVYVRGGRTYSGGLVIGGTVPVVDDRDGSGWARAFKLAHKQRPRVQKNVWQCSLRTHVDDRRLSDDEWNQVADQLAERLGFAEHPYVVVRHADDHVHVAVSRVADDGKVWKGAHDFRAVRPVMREAEQRYGLTEVPDHQQAPAPKTGLTQGEERRARRTGQTPVRADLAMNVRAAVDVAAGSGRAGFEAELDRAGILYRANVASTGRVNGYSFADPNRLDGDGQPVWFSASKLDRGLSWSKMAPTLDGPAKHRPAPGGKPVEPRKRLESGASFQRRTDEARAESDRIGRNRYRHERTNALRGEQQQHARFWTTQPVTAPPKKTAPPAAVSVDRRSTVERAAAGPLGAPAPRKPTQPTAVERAAAGPLGAPPPESAAARAARLARRGVTQANPTKAPVKKKPVEPSHQDRARRAAQKPQDPRRGMSR